MKTTLSTAVLAVSALGWGCGAPVASPPAPSPTRTTAPTPTPTSEPAIVRSFLFVHESGGMTGYEVDETNGSLSQVSFAPGPDELIPQPGGRFAFSLSCSTTNTCTFLTFEITADGDLIDTQRATTFRAEPFISTASPRFLYNVCGSNTGVEISLCTFGIAPETGATSQLASFATRERTGMTDSNGIDAIAVTANGTILYSAEQDSVLVPYRIADNGLGQPERSVHFPGIGKSIALHPGGRFLYLLTQGATEGRLALFTLDAQGAPTLVRVVDTAFDKPMALTMDPRGRFLYATAAQGVEPYVIDGETGLLSGVRRLPSTDKPYSGIAIEPTGRFAYLARAGSLWGYTVDTESGALSDLGRMAPGLGSMIIVPR